ncbi:hypothetical protein [Amycolatopsis sp. NPDC004079]|uniref:hypothetical protein n=1 Tax=Amycolatopsis sp. NPDC004079 TaxID=3154549 RepID=UPI0033B4D9DE
MGANNFSAYQPGTDPEESFRAAVAAAEWEDGAGGYTGTIAEKAVEGFRIIRSEPVEPEEAARIGSDVLREDGDERWADIRDKWGRAGGIAVKAGLREHQVDIPETPGGYPDEDAAVAAAMTDRLVEGEHVVYGRSGSWKYEGRRVVGGSLTVPTEGAQVHTGWLWVGKAPT